MKMVSFCTDSSFYTSLRLMCPKDHMVIIEAMEDYIREMKKSGDFSTESI